MYSVPAFYFCFILYLWDPWVVYSIQMCLLFIIAQLCTDKHFTYSQFKSTVANSSIMNILKYFLVSICTYFIEYEHTIVKLSNTSPKCSNYILISNYMIDSSLLCLVSRCPSKTTCACSWGFWGVDGSWMYDTGIRDVWYRFSPLVGHGSGCCWINLLKGEALLGYGGTHQ